MLTLLFLSQPFRGRWLSVTYAKLERPRLHNAYLRPRLFEQLAALCAAHPIIWISAPPGAGKTTLTATFLARSAPPTAWCQLDEGDSDPATLFFFLGEAVREMECAQAASAPALREHLPTPLEQVFFRDFYGKMPRRSVLVLDNAHEFDWHNAGGLLETALNAVPANVNVIVLSREPPPPRLSRMELDGRIATLGARDLRFTAAEAIELAQPTPAHAQEFHSLVEQLDGWAAGIIMLRNHLHHAQPSATPILDSKDAVFRYFAGEIFDRMPADARRLLLLLSCLPGVTCADAEQLTGSDAASQLLETLYRNRLFVERRGDQPYTYHFHGLFSEFLQLQARQGLASVERHALLVRAGTMFEGRGRIDEAAKLYQDAQAHEELVGFLLRRAADMLAAGRAHTWREWMSTLPASYTDMAPWLWYWHGVSLIQVAPLRARRMLQRTAHSFAEAGNDAALLATVAAIIDSYDHEWTELEALPAWIDRLGEVLARSDLARMDPLLDLRVHSRLILALLLVKPDSPLLAPAAEHALRALRNVDSPFEKLMAGAILLRYFDWNAARDAAQWLVADLSRIAEDAGVSAFHRVWWHGRVARWYSKDGKYSEAEKSAGDARSIVASFGLNPLLFQFLELDHLLGVRDLPAARALLDRVRPALVPTSKTDWIEFHSLDMQWHALSGDIPAAVQAALALMGMSAEVGIASAGLARSEALLAALYALAGDVEQSQAWFGKAASHAYGHDALLVEEARQFVLAYLCSAGGDEAGAARLLRPVLTAHRLRQSSRLFAAIPVLASHLAALALKYGIETEHVRALVIRQQLPAPQRRSPNWPWPVAVRTLGKFELTLFGQPVVANGKAQQRPLLLLKALVAGGNASRPQKMLCDQFWPDGDDPRAALHITVHRLRKLLQGDDLVLMTAGAVQLAPDRVWSDVALLAELCTEIDGFSETTLLACVEQASVALLGIYQGSFCDEGEGGAMAAAAIRWRNRFLTASTTLGRLLEHGQRWHHALALYQRALDAEPLAENLYRGAMRCAIAQNDAGSALSTYRKCKEMLSIVMGRQPSAETEQLASQLGFRTQ